MQPNIVMIVADQLNSRLLGCTGNPVIHTPHIDALAGKGILFENAYCQTPICMPSRSSFNTGLYPHTLGVHHNPVQLPDRFTTLAQRLAGHGYETAGIGHIGGDGVERGFAHKIDLWDMPLRQAFMDEMDAILPGMKQFTMAHSGVHPLPRERQFDYQAARCAVDYISRASRPFFLQLDFYGPHAPWFVSEPFASLHDSDDIPLPPSWRDSLTDKPSNMYGARRATSMEQLEESALRRALAFYYGKISHIDSLTGWVIDALEEKGILDTTILLFMGDHGDFASEFGLFGKNGQLYDCLTRVPLIVNAPQLADATGRVKQPVELVDVAPTLLKMAGVPVPEALPGRDLVEIPPNSGEGSDQAQAVFASSLGSQSKSLPYDHAWPEEDLKPCIFDPYSTGTVEGWSSVMVRQGRYKLIAYVNGFTELFDLESDPWERTNLSGTRENESVERALLQRLLTWQIETWNPQVPQRGLPYHYRAFVKRRIPRSFHPTWDAWQAEHSDGAQASNGNTHTPQNPRPLALRAAG